MVRQGVVDLDKPVYQYLPKPLPDYPFYRDLAGDERYKLITLRMCLDHTTGFPNLRAFTDDHKLNINFTPGSRFAYSGEGILLAQFVVETVTKKSAKRADARAHLHARWHDPHQHGLGGALRERLRQRL